METNDTTIERIRQVVGNVLKVAPNTLRLTDTVFGNEDGLVSGLRWVEANMAIANEFRLHIPEEDEERLETIGDYVSYIRRRQAGLSPFEEKPAPAPLSTQRRMNRKKSRVEPQEQQHQEDSYPAWEFHHGHWEHTENTIRQGELETDQEVTQLLQQRGYKPVSILRMGKQEQGMHVEVYVKEHKEDNGTQNYYTRLWIGPEVESIYVSNLPSLLTLLHRLGPIIANSLNVEEVSSSS